MGTQPVAGAVLVKTTPPNLPPFSARITRADFPPPPELADRDPATAPGGHVGGLRAELHQPEGRMRSSWDEPIFRIRYGSSTRSSNGPVGLPCCT